MTMTAEQAEIARLTSELRNVRAAQDARLQRRMTAIAAMADSLALRLMERDDRVEASCLLEISAHITELHERIRELLPADSKVTPLSRRVAS